jgi:hypothetical protein
MHLNNPTMNMRPACLQQDERTNHQRGSISHGS